MTKQVRLRSGAAMVAALCVVTTPASAQRGAPTEEAASRFLVQASFGADMDAIDEVRRLGYEGWLRAQMALPAPSALDRMLADGEARRTDIDSIFWEFAVDGEDQLRQRVAYALSQILVVSADLPGGGRSPETYAAYMDILQDEAFGNYEDLVREVTLSPAMGIWLSHIASRREDTRRGTAPDENYARELMQLFTIGLVELDEAGRPVGGETYTTEDVQGLARVFTGLGVADNGGFRRRPRRNATLAQRTGLMEGYDRFHETGPKRFLGATVNGSTPEQSIERALDEILAHDNVAPFVSRQLIQRLVTSNPRPGYVRRVAQAYEAGRYRLPSGRRIGTGRRGDMQAVVSAILMHPQARQQRFADNPSFGKVREPVLRVAQWARAFRDDRSFRRNAPVGRLNRSNRSTELGQRPLAPPSVFNFYRPGYVAAGSLTADAGLVAPELQITTSATTASYVNFMSDVIPRGRQLGGQLRPDYADELPLADSPQGLVDHLDTMLTYGSLEEGTKRRIVQAVSAIPTDRRNRHRQDRLTVALLMVTTSPEYVTQR